MPTRNFWLAAMALAFVFAQSKMAKAEVAPPGRVVVIASPSILPAGSHCRVVMHPEDPEKSPTVFTIFEGTIKETTKDKVVLTGATFEQHSTNNSFLGKFPFVGRYFKNTGIARTPIKKDAVPIPIDEIRSITLIEETKQQTGAGKK